MSAAARGIAAGYVPGGSTALRFDLRSGEATAVATTVMPSVVTPGGVLGGVDLSDRPALVIGSRTKHLPNLGFDGYRVDRGDHPGGPPVRDGSPRGHLRGRPLDLRLTPLPTQKRSGAPGARAPGAPDPCVVPGQLLLRVRVY